MPMMKLPAVAKLFHWLRQPKNRLRQRSGTRSAIQLHQAGAPRCAATRVPPTTRKTKAIPKFRQSSDVPRSGIKAKARKDVRLMRWVMRKISRRRRSFSARKAPGGSNVGPRYVIVRTRPICHLAAWSHSCRNSVSSTLPGALNVAQTCPKAPPRLARAAPRARPRGLSAPAPPVLLASMRCQTLFRNMIGERRGLSPPAGINPALAC